LVNDILDISRIDAERVKLNFQPLDLALAIEGVLPSFEYQIQEKNLSLTINTPADLPKAYADSDRINQILINLIGNSVKYTRPGDSITVQVHANESQVQIDVSDTGLGIAEEDQIHVFDRFFRAERDANSLVDGTGLGLPIARSFVEMMGGEIWLDSALGVGSTFSFTLPIYQSEVSVAETN